MSFLNFLIALSPIIVVLVGSPVSLRSTVAPRSQPRNTRI